MEEQKDNDRALRSIRMKMSDSRVRVDTVVRECERLDKNSDGRVHADDLEDVIHDLLGPSTLNRREMNLLTKSVEVDERGGMGRSVDYKALTEVLEPHTGARESALRDSTNFPRAFDERWDETAATALGSTQGRRANRNKNGSVGEWLQMVSCPAEQRNFRKFIDCMEAYEASSGMKVIPNERGFVVPLGPDLRAQVNFYQA